MSDCHKMTSSLNDKSGDYISNGDNAVFAAMDMDQVVGDILVFPIYDLADRPRQKFSIGLL
ncbi:hypothetical protein D3C76_1777460 [compost metagenome]